MSKLMKAYQKLVLKNMLVVQALQTGTLMATGDVLAQTVIERKSLNKIEPLRTAQFFALGSIMVGPALSKWYTFLSKRMLGTATAMALKKVAADQLIFAPSFLVVFISTLNLIEGNGLKKVKQELKLKYTDILIANYKLWPAVQIFNFYFVPLRHQVLLVQSVALIWNVYISWKTHLEVEDTK